MQIFTYIKMNIKHFNVFFKKKIIQYTFWSPFQNFQYDYVEDYLKKTFSKIFSLDNNTQEPV